MGCQKLTYQATENTNLKVVYRARKVAQRFLSLDPAAMEYPSLSDYNYVAGNPIMFIDPDGKRIDNWQLNDDGSLELLERTDDLTHNIFNEEGKLIQSTHIGESNFKMKYELAGFHETLMAYEKVQQAFNRAENQDAFEDMVKRSEDMKFGWKSRPLYAKRALGKQGNVEDVLGGLFGSVTFVNIFKGISLTPGGIPRLYEGATSGNNVFNDLYNYVSNGLENTYNKFSTEFNKGINNLPYY